MVGLLLLFVVLQVLSVYIRGPLYSCSCMYSYALLVWIEAILNLVYTELLSSIWCMGKNKKNRTFRVRFMLQHCFRRSCWNTHLLSHYGSTIFAFDTIIFAVSLCTIFIVPVYGRAMLAPTCSIMLRRIDRFNGISSSGRQCGCGYQMYFRI